MSRTCKECPIAQTVDSDRSKYQEGLDNGLFLQAIQGLSGKMVRGVKGTAAGLTEARIESIRQSEVKSWQRSGGEEEAGYLQDRPELAKAVHDCELKIQMGECVIHSLQKS